jgi:hypothetical protein
VPRRHLILRKKFHTSSSKEEKVPPDARKHYRIQPDQGEDVAVYLLQDGGWTPARVSDVSVGGIGLFVEGAPRFTPGLTTFVRICSPLLPLPSVEPGKVEYVRETEDGCRYGITFLDWMGLLERIPTGLAHLFNRRGSTRVPAEEDQAVHIYFEADGVAQEVDGRLSNISLNGVGFFLEPKMGTHLVRSDLVLISFRFPGTDEYVSLRAKLRHIHKKPDHWQIGAYFADEGIDFEKKKAQISCYLGNKESLDFPVDPDRESTHILKRGQ